MHFTPDQQRILLDLARGSIRRAMGQPVQPMVPRDAVYFQLAGCFVSLHERATHRLRGCVGRLDANAPLAQAVYEISHGVLNDPRFTNDRLTVADLPNIQLDISVIGPLLPAAGPMDFDLLNDGIYLTYKGRTGCFLPQVARETGWDKEALLNRLCTEKLGLPPLTWHSPEARLMVFNTVVIGPEPFIAE